VKGLYIFSVLVLSSAAALAEDPVFFADLNLKAAVEAQLGITDPTPNDMLSLMFLPAYCREIVDLSGLEYAANITTLYLSSNQISDINPLSGLTNLTVLDLGFNEITDINALSDLTNMSNLDLGKNYISNLDALSSLTNLEVLNLRNNQITFSTLNALSSLTNLYNLNLSYNQLNDINSLSYLTNLTFLGLTETHISEIQSLSSLTNLITLELCYNSISDINSLSGLTNMIELKLYGNQITDINALSGMTNLTSLSLNNNQISDVSPVSGLTNLAYLSIVSNHISDINALSGLSNLTSLQLGYNQISDINVLSGLTNLSDLSLLSNNIADIEPLIGLTKLDRLYLQGNPLNVFAYCFHLSLIEENNTGITLNYSPNPYSLRGDGNGDCFVDFLDFALLARDWLDGFCYDCEGDFNGDWAVGIYDLTIMSEDWLGQVMLYQDILSYTPSWNWTTEGQWEFGQAIGGGLYYGYPDPGMGYTNAAVFGVNLSGDYDINVGGPYYLTAGPFDCRRFHNMKLKFARWLNTDEPAYVKSMIDVSNNGTTWTEVWSHSGREPITDSEWQLLEYDISSVADDQETVYVRWGYQIFEYAYPYSGWNIDDIQLWGSL